MVVFVSLCVTETCGGCVCQSLCDRDMWWLCFDSLCVTETCGGCVLTVYV